MATTSELMSAVTADVSTGEAAVGKLKLDAAGVVADVAAAEVALAKLKSDVALLAASLAPPVTVTKCTVLPTIVGTLKVGGRHTTSSGTWINLGTNPVFSWKWTLDGVTLPFTSWESTPQTNGSLVVYVTANGVVAKSPAVMITGGVVTPPPPPPPPPDTTPDQFKFVDLTGALPNTQYKGNPIEVSGLGSGVSVPITVVGGQYIKNGGVPTSAPGTVVNGDTIIPMPPLTGQKGTSVSVTITIGK